MINNTVINEFNAALDKLRETGHELLLEKRFTFSNYTSFSKFAQVVQHLDSADIMMRVFEIEEYGWPVKE